MKKIKYFLIALVATVTLAGCGASSNMTTNINNNQTDVVLSCKNFHVVKTVQSEVSATYFLGIGGLSKKALQNNAVADLTKNAGLTGSQALVNITVKASVAEYIFVTKVTYYAEATVIEFDK